MEKIKRPESAEMACAQIMEGIPEKATLCPIEAVTLIVSRDCSTVGTKSAAKRKIMPDLCRHERR